jgi:hypothetical protein
VREEHGLPGGDGIVLVLDPTIGRADIGSLCARFAELVRGRAVGAGVVVCDVSAVIEASGVVVEALARLRLTARRLGADLRVHGAQPELRGLLAFTGLAGAVLGDASALDPAPALGAASAVQRQGQAEEREDPLDIEEVGDAADPVA